ncbi:MAG: hypothetical protein HY370_08200 [Proteobacteria bacterium]|nr:hypothetical protein [Pseudomonadota bacterium]
MSRLQKKFAAYFHQDCLDVYGSYQDTIRAFAEALDDPQEVEQLLREAAITKDTAREAVRVIDGFSIKSTGMTEQQWLIWLADRLAEAMKSKIK